MAKLRLPRREMGGERSDPRGCRLAAVVAEIAGELTGATVWRSFDNRRQLAACAGLALAATDAAGKSAQSQLSRSGAIRP